MHVYKHTNCIKTNYQDKLKNKCTRWYTLFDTLASRYLTA